MAKLCLLLVGFALAGAGIGCQRQYDEEQHPNYPSPAAQAKNRLLALHSDWYPIVRGPTPHTRLDWNVAFRLSGYLSLTPSIKKFPGFDAQHALGYGTPQEINASKVPELHDSLWHGLVYVRHEYSLQLRSGQPHTEPGWYGRVLVRDGCLFFGDMDMLKQIDKDLR